MMNLARLILEGDKAVQVEKLLRNGADPNEVDDDATPILVLASGLEGESVVSLLLAAGAKVDSADADDDTALHRAAATNNLASIGLLLRAGAKVDAVNVDGKTPLIIASIMGHAEACRRLTGAGADINWIDVRGRTSLHWAAIRNDDAELIQLLIHLGGKSDLSDIDGYTPADLARLMGHQEAFIALSRGELSE